MALRATLFFLAAGVWLAGVILDDTRITGVALVILALAILLRLIGRRRDRAGAERESES